MDTAQTTFRRQNVVDRYLYAPVFEKLFISMFCVHIYISVHLAVGEYFPYQFPATIERETKLKISKKKSMLFILE